MAIGVLGVAGALVLGGVILYAVLATSLTRTVQSEALASVREVALLVSSGRIPNPVPASARRWCRCCRPTTGSSPVRSPPTGLRRS